MNDPILDNLNPQQYAAVTAPDGPLLIVAGAGTGKTRVITRRLAMLVRDRGIRPWQIFAATFTNKAADEMKHRVAALIDGLCSPEFHISTFHSFCSRILRREAKEIGLDPNFTICDDKDQISVLRHVLGRLDISDKTLKPADAQFVINQCKMRMLGPEDVTQIATNYEELYTLIYEEYEKYLRESSAVDFEDLILRVVRMFQESPLILERYQDRYRHVMVDEYQDTNKVQVEFVSLLAGHHKNLAVVGDEDQSIYSWRGADINNLLDFQHHFPDAKIIRLEQNYRCTGNILKAAGSVIGRNKERLGKNLFTEDGAGAPVYFFAGADENEEAAGTVYAIDELCKRQKYQYSDIAVFYRMGSLARVFEDKLRENKIPYRIVGGIRFYDRAEIKDLLSYLQVVANPNNSIALNRIINMPRRGVGDKTLDTLQTYSERARISLYGALNADDALEMIPKKAQSTLKSFVATIKKWQEFIKENSVSALYREILKDTEYVEKLGDPKQPEVLSKKDNLDELLNAIVSYEKQHPNTTLTDYLENVSLVNATDNLKDGDNAVSLMTLHAAKGLEYKAVFLVGMEDGLFPSLRAVTERGDYEEERRLFYVGITRAREILVLTRSDKRLWYGETKYNQPSGFLTELPQEVLRNLDIYNPVFHNNLEEAPDNEPEYIRPDPVRRPSGGGYGEYTPRSAYSKAGYSETSNQARQMQHLNGLCLGSRVRHPLLGEGIVTGISGQGAKAQLILQLDDGDVHRLLARYANLQILDGD